MAEPADLKWHSAAHKSWHRGVLAHRSTLARRLPGILARLAELSSIALDAIDDPSHETAALHQSLSRGGA